jgi:glycosyltransferase involved in cell wall biosynthesis
MNEVKKQMKICMVTQSYHASDPRVRREAETAVASGFAVDVICLQKQGEERKSRLNGVNIYGVPLAKKRGGFLRYVFEYLLFFCCAFWMITALHLRKQYQLIQIHTLPDFLVFAAIIPRLLGAKVILDMHEIMPEFFASKFKVNKDHHFIRLLIFTEKLSTKFADHIIAVNDPIQELLTSRGVPSAKITVVMNSVDENLFKTTVSQKQNRKRSAFTLMYHGTLTDIYGLDIAIKALHLVRKEIPDVEFHILGEGPVRADLARLVCQLDLTDKVVFHGKVPLEAIPEYLNACDVGVLPTRQDEFLDLSFSNKLLEYIFMDKPVVASRLMTTAKYFPESSISYFIPHDYVQLAERIVSLFADPQKTAAQIASARQNYRKISWDIMRKRYLGLLDTM